MVATFGLCWEPIIMRLAYRQIIPYLFSDCVMEYCLTVFIQHILRRSYVKGFRLCIFTEFSASILCQLASVHSDIGKEVS